MDKLFESSINYLKNTSLDFVRYLPNEIDWNNRLIAITGARGVGKTTMLLQHIKQNLKIDSSTLYISLDDLYFSNNTLSDAVDRFVKLGGKHIFIDEVHKYPEWSREIKNIYDKYNDLNIIITGSSILDIYQGYADLSRRAVSYSLTGMSFREFLKYANDFDFPILTVDEIISNHIEISMQISEKIKPIAEFHKYLRFGYYPFYKENLSSYHQKLLNTINVVLENDLPVIHNIEFQNIYKLRKLLYIIAQSVPFKANVTKLSERVGVSRNTIIQFFEYLRKAKTIKTFYNSSKGYGKLTKPEKIYLDNTNLITALAEKDADIGNIRETFFLNQLSAKYRVSSAESADFLIDNKYIFEVGGKNKTEKQIKNLPDSFLAVDDIESGFAKKIPLWLFGFLY